MADGFLGAYVIDYTSLLISLLPSARVLKECDRLILEITDPLKQAVARELVLYMRHRSAQSYAFSSNEAQINDRANFIKTFIQALARNDGSERALLKEDKIIRFKGFFSHHLYDLLAGYRDGYTRPMQNYLFCLSKIPDIRKLEKKAFAEELLSYMRVRMNSKFYFSRTLDLLNRFSYISRFFEVLSDNDQFNQDKLTAEKRIVGFKGFFSQRLYGLITAYRKTVQPVMEIEMRERPRPR